MIVIAGTITIDPTKREEAFAAAKVIMEETHKEPGNLAYAFSADLEDDAVVRIFEEWESQEAFEKFSQETLAPAMQRAGYTQHPDVKVWPVHNTVHAH